MFLADNPANGFLAPLATGNAQGPPLSATGLARVERVWKTRVMEVQSGTAKVREKLAENCLKAALEGPESCLKSPERRSETGAKWHWHRTRSGLAPPWHCFGTVGVYSKRLYNLLWFAR
jgi:hypothetical protein